MNYGMGPNFGFGPQFGNQPSYCPGMNWGGGYGFTPPANAWMGPASMGWGLGGMRTWGGTYSPQFMSTGLPTDKEIVEMVYDSMDDDPFIPFDAEINVDSDAGTVTLTGTVHSKLVKHAAGDDAWWIPGVDDVRNELRVVAPQRGPIPETARGEAPRRPTGTTPRAKPTPTVRTAATGTMKVTGTTAGKPATGAKKGTGATTRAAPTATKGKTSASARTATSGTSTTGTGTRSATGTRRAGSA